MFPVDPSVLCQAARCYVDSCPCATALLNCPTVNISRDCIHIRAAITCTTDAEPLEIDSSVVDSVSSVTEDVRTILRHFITNDICPVIQRVTRSVFVVRSQPSCEHTLEFVHVTFAESVRTRVNTSPKFTCDCRAFQVHTFKMLASQLFCLGLADQEKMRPQDDFLWFDAVLWNPFRVLTVSLI